jgi:hypothetical protein
MVTKLITYSLASAFLFLACQSKKENNPKTQITQEQVQNTQDAIPFTIAQNYFVKNTVDSITDPKIETQEVFNSYFGMATTMGKNGKPTKIDFTKQYVIAIMLPTTDFATTINPISLKKENGNTILFSYKIEKGNQQSYSSKPFSLLIVDKKYVGNLSLKPLD